jgi:hypothetical protein
VSKDVVYVDAEDDITDIIGKVKASKEAIVAIVPPKRVGALQSAVNLKLLAKSAKSEEKQVVLITGNRAIEPLAAVAKIPVARTLQTKPEIPEISALEDDNGEIDVIEGEKVPVGVGELDEAVKATAKDDDSAEDDMDDQLLSSIALDDDDRPERSSRGRKDGKKSKGGVPNFDKFRKKLLIGIGIGVLVIGFLVWAIVFAPRATIIIKTKLSKIDVSEAVIFTTDQSQSNAKKGTILIKKQQLSKKSEVEFDPTGSKKIGEKAKGTLTVSNCDDTNSFNIAAGTKFTSSGLVFISTASASVSGMTGSASACQNSGTGAGTGTVSVQAADVGEDYNLPVQKYTASGVSGYIYFSGSAMSGGSSRTVKAVSQDDINKAKEKLSEANDAAAKKELAGQMSSDFIVIDSSMKVDLKDPVSTPAVDQEASGKAKLSAETIYTVYGADRSQVKEFLIAKLSDGLNDKEEQKIYSNGVDDAYFDQFVDDGGKMSARLKTVAQIGPKIDEKHVREVSKGKRYGEVQGELESISGVESVDIKFSPFWVSKVPGSDSKITVEFKSK